MNEVRLRRSMTAMLFVSQHNDKLLNSIVRICQRNRGGIIGIIIHVITVILCRKHQRLLCLLIWHRDVTCAELNYLTLRWISRADSLAGAINIRLTDRWGIKTGQSWPIQMIIGKLETDINESRCSSIIKQTPAVIKNDNDCVDLLLLFYSAHRCGCWFHSRFQHFY